MIRAMAALKDSKPRLGDDTQLDPAQLARRVPNTTVRSDSRHTVAGKRPHASGGLRPESPPTTSPSRTISSPCSRTPAAAKLKQASRETLRLERPSPRRGAGPTDVSVPGHNNACAAKRKLCEAVGQTDLQRRLWSDAVRSADATFEHGNDEHTDLATSGQRWRLSDERQLCGNEDQVHLRRRLWNNTVRCDDATVGHWDGVRTAYQCRAYDGDCAAKEIVWRRWQVYWRHRGWNATVRGDDATVGHWNGVHTNVSVSGQ